MTDPLQEQSSQPDSPAESPADSNAENQNHGKKVTAKKRRWLWPIVGTIAAHLVLVVLLMWQGVIGNPFATNTRPAPKSAAGGSPSASQPADADAAAAKAPDPRLAKLTKDAMAAEKKRLASLSEKQRLKELETKSQAIKQMKDVDKAVDLISAVSGLDKQKGVAKPRGDEPDLGPFNEKMSYFYKVDDTRIDPETGKKLIVFTLRDRGFRLKHLTVPFDELTDVQHRQYRMLQRIWKDPRAENAFRTRHFDAESSRYYDVDDTQTDERTGEKLYIFTLLDKNGRSIEEYVTESRLQPFHRSQFQLLKMKKDNPNMNKLLDAANAFAQQIAEQRRRQAEQDKKRRKKLQEPNDQNK